jgi:hypothetical protein
VALPTLLAAFLGMAVCAVPFASPTASEAATPAAHSPVGALDRLVVISGGVRAVGWAFDPDAPKVSIRVSVVVDGAVAATAAANRTRDDVAQAYPEAGPAHGFNFRSLVPEGDHRVCVVALNIKAGANTSLGCITRNFDYGPIGKFESSRKQSGELRAVGWTFDRDDPLASLTVRIDIDGFYDVAVVADVARPDIAAKYPVAGALHGFDLHVPVSYGKHMVCVTAVNIGFGEDTTFPCRTIDVTRPLTAG